MTKLEQSHVNSGKGMSRVEIAQRAWEKASATAEACKKRLEEAKKAAKAAEKRDAGKKEKALVKARALVAAADNKA